MVQQDLGFQLRTYPGKYIVLFFSVNYDLCDLGVQYVLAGIFDKCLKAMAHRSNKPKKTVDFVIKKAEVLIPYVIKKQNEFQHYANG